jgi:hypothetical protein
MKLKKRVVVQHHSLSRTPIVGGCYTSVIHLTDNDETYIKNFWQWPTTKEDRWGGRILWEDE